MRLSSAAHLLVTGNIWTYYFPNFSYLHTASKISISMPTAWSWYFFIHMAYERWIHSLIYFRSTVSRNTHKGTSYYYIVFFLTSIKHRTLKGKKWTLAYHLPHITMPYPRKQSTQRTIQENIKLQVWQVLTRGKYSVSSKYITEEFISLISISGTSLRKWAVTCKKSKTWLAKEVEYGLWRTFQTGAVACAKALWQMGAQCQWGPRVESMGWGAWCKPRPASKTEARDGRGNQVDSTVQHI